MNLCKKLYLKFKIFFKQSDKRHFDRHLRKYYKNINHKQKAYKNLLSASKYIKNYDTYLHIKRMIKRIKEN